jgi:hypothetical protein
MSRPARLTSLAVGAMLPLLACGSSSSSSSASSGGSLDCAWLASSSNCWKSTGAAASNCLPASSDTGKLSTDLKSCTFTTGQAVTFDPALTLPLPQQPNFNFTVTSGGNACFSFTQPDQHDFSETTTAGTASVSASGAAEVLTCPDGSSVSGSAQQVLQDLSCDGGALGGVPGTLWTSSNTSVTFTLLGAGTGGDLPVFSCSM